MKRLAALAADAKLLQEVRVTPARVVLQFSVESFQDREAKVQIDDIEALLTKHGFAARTDWK
jgi:hypothetical protein